MFRQLAFTTTLLIAMSFHGAGFAQGLNPLLEIQHFADAYCPAVQQSGSAYTASATTIGEAGLSKLLREFGAADLKGELQLKINKFSGALQKDIGPMFVSEAHCREITLHVLAPEVFGLVRIHPELATDKNGCVAGDAFCLDATEGGKISGIHINDSKICATRLLDALAKAGGSISDVEMNRIQQECKTEIK